MHTFTLYDSAFTHKNPNLSPVHHLRCDLKLCNESKNMLINNNIVKDIEKFPTTLRCVLTEIPEISFDSNWKDGATTHMFEPITNLLNDTTLGKIIQVAAAENFVPLVQTNEFSQKVQESVSRPSLKLKFTVFTDTYNSRYNFASSPYETWLKMLYFSTAPIYKASYKNVVSSVKAAATNLKKEKNTVSTFIDAAKNGASGAMNSLPFVGEREEAGKQLMKAAGELGEVSDVIMKYLSRANNTGHIGWDIVIPNYLHSTDNTSASIIWNVKSFDVSFSDKFTRGLLDANNISIYRPRPLYAQFEVALTANQCMTKEQYIKMLFGDIYDGTVTRENNTSNTNNSN